MPDAMQDRINEFVVDICRFSTQLERISRRGYPEERPAAAEQARRSYEELLQRMHTLALGREDKSRIRALLKPVRARLRLLR